MATQQKRSKSTTAASYLKVLLILQENSGMVEYEPPGTPGWIHQAISSVIDHLAETFEDIKNGLVARGRYDKMELMTDANCTRANLLENLIKYSKSDNVIDLIVLGHGNDNLLGLHGNEDLHGGSGGNLRSLLTDARARGCAKFNLRMVYMCDCYSSTLNDDWTAIGARVSIGSGDNYMAEPTTTFFMENWIAGQDADSAANNAFSSAIPYFVVAFPPQLIPRYRTERIRYISGGHMSGRPPHWVPDYSTKEVSVFDHYDSVNNDKIESSRLVVGGDSHMSFNGTYDVARDLWTD
jgi:hypothetical protein